MPFFSLLKNTLTATFYGFGSMTVLYSLAMLAAHDTNASMSVTLVLLFFPFCFFISLARELLKASKLRAIARISLLYVAVLISTGFFILPPHKDTLNGATVFVLFFGISLFYLAACLIRRAVPTKKVSKETEYTSVYKNATKK